MVRGCLRAKFIFHIYTSYVICMQSEPKQTKAKCIHIGWFRSGKTEGGHSIQKALVAFASMSQLYMQFLFTQCHVEHNEYI